MDNTRDFPKNTEVEAMLTFVTEGTPKGEFVAEVTPDPHAITVREHTSMVELPGPGYTPRRFDPRSGFFAVNFRDYSVPLGERLDQRFIARHRLEKRDPKAAVSEPVKPIVYYVDRGAPEPIRSALVEGANWWAQAFEAAGFKNAFRVEVLPEGADPMDIRYNMIQWVHRATRGWSYGEAVTDPRTGEIIKGQVTLGSLRAQQDYMIAEALLSPYAEGKPIPKDMEAMVLARTRQLAAHEVGHTLGLQHNFAASSLGQGTSVMDYPHPWITLDASGKLRPVARLRRRASARGTRPPFGTGIRSSRRAPMKPPLSTSCSRQNDSRRPPLHHRCRRPSASAARIPTPISGTTAATHPPNSPASSPSAKPPSPASASRPSAPASPWPSSKTPSCRSISCTATRPKPRPSGSAASTTRYAVRGDGEMVTEPIPRDQQLAALHAVLETLKPENLTLPESLLRLLPPRPPDYPRTRESFAAHTGLTFDAEGPVEAAAGLTASLLFHPSRATRLVEYHARDPKQLASTKCSMPCWPPPGSRRASPASEAETQFTVEDVVLSQLLGLAAAKDASGQARAIALAAAIKLEDWLKSQTGNPASPEAGAHWAAAIATIDRFRNDPAKFAPAPELPTPPGQPIGVVEEDAPW